jgi:uncharacterized protein YndB with AHSA1/START domain
MTTSHDLTVTKHIQAPRAKVFAAWTTPEIMKHWFFPTGMSVSNAESDIRVGGTYRATLSGAQGTSTVFGVYREIVAGERLVFTHSWDEGDRREPGGGAGATAPRCPTRFRVTWSGTRAPIPRARSTTRGQTSMRHGSPRTPARRSLAVRLDAPMTDEADLAAGCYSSGSPSTAP